MEAGSCKIAGSLRCGVMVFGQNTKLFCKRGQHVKSCGSIEFAKTVKMYFCEFRGAVLWLLDTISQLFRDSRTSIKKVFQLAVLWAMNIQTD